MGNSSNQAETGLGRRQAQHQLNKTHGKLFCLTEGHSVFMDSFVLFTDSIRTKGLAILFYLFHLCLQGKCAVHVPHSSAVPHFTFRLFSRRESHSAQKIMRMLVSNNLGLFSNTFTVLFKIFLENVSHTESTVMCCISQVAATKVYWNTQTKTWVLSINKLLYSASLQACILHSQLSHSVTDRHFEDQTGVLKEAEWYTKLIAAIHI